jgi:hypothetical protein
MGKKLFPLVMMAKSEFGIYAMVNKLVIHLKVI